MNRDLYASLTSQCMKVEQPRVRLVTVVHCNVINVQFTIFIFVWLFQPSVLC